MAAVLSDEERRLAKRQRTEDSSYFDGYGDLQCHLMMLLDTSRTDAYRRAIFDCSDKLRGKVVIDVGAGTGILSIFACQAGAAKVHAVEASDVYRHMVDIVNENKFDKQIVVHHTRVEELSLDGKVDCVLSEWMGYALFCEWMLKSVISARDKFLVRGGLMIPSRARLFIAPVTLTDCLLQRTRQWYTVRDQFNVNMDFICRVQERNSRGRIFVHPVDPTEVVGCRSKVVDLDLYVVKKSDLVRLKGDFSCECYGNCLVYGFCLWFDVEMTGGKYLDTSPYAEPTHWQQVALYVRPFQVDQGKLITGSLTISQNPTELRNFRATVEFRYDDQEKHVIHFQDME